MKRLPALLLLGALVGTSISMTPHLVLSQPARVETAAGAVEGVTEGGVHVFKGIPYAAPPVRDLRWRPPQPVEPWNEVLQADRFADQCMQRPVFNDMQFRNSGVSEDCLYLNVWTPDASADAALPVLVYFYGGGFIAGDGSEPRYDGASMAQEGIVVVTTSYRLGVFGFFAHPELTAEAPEGASGNYTLLDQAASLQWVHDNIEVFGGDPSRVTIAGESAGSFSVSAQMASPLSKHLIAGAIGESGSLLGSFSPAPLEEMEERGVDFGERIGATSLEALRDVPAMALLQASARSNMPRFSTTVDGYFFPDTPLEIYAAGEQAHVPLLVGWNTEEMNYRAVLGQREPTPDNFEAAVRDLYGDDADAILAAYSASTPTEILQAATDLAGDRFIGYGTWKWFEVHRKTGNAPVYRYLYAHPRPPMKPEYADGPPPSAPEGVQPPRGAVHSAEIEYALGNLDANPLYEWDEDDYAVSEVLKGYFANFIKTGDPSGPGLPEWPASGIGDDAALVRIDTNTETIPDRHRERYLLLDRLATD